MIARRTLVATAAFALLLGPASSSFGEDVAVSADEHAKHHPGAAGGGASPGQPSPMGMMGEMGGMMQSMHGPPKKELYPALMELPDLPLEKRGELGERARERMRRGLQRMSESIEALSTGTERGDRAAMQEATETLRQALAEFDSGLSTERALAEGLAPRNVALRWFKREMNLLEPPPSDRPHGFFGLSWFHYFAMFIVTAFAVALGGIQIARMRRARELAARLASAAPPRLATSQKEITGREMPVPKATVTPAPAPATPSTTGSWSGKVRVARIFQETPSVKTFRLAPLEGEELPFAFEPGQFVAVGVTVDGKTVKRSYSIASSPCCHGWCEITVKHVTGGVVSGILHERTKVGDVVDVGGPYGRFTFRGREAPSVVMIAAGVGITPMMSSIRFLTDQSWEGDIHLVYGCTRLDEVIFREELEYLGKRHHNLHVTVVLSQEPAQTWTGPRGNVTGEVLRETVPDLESRRIHVCGPPPMMDAVKTSLAKLGVPSAHVKTELFLTPEVKAPPLVPTPAPAVTATCTFTRSGKKAPLPADRTILDVAEEIGVPIEYSCRQGFCGVCKVKLSSGRVSMAVEDGLSSAEKAGGWILACQAKAEADASVDA